MLADRQLAVLSQRKKRDRLGDRRPPSLEDFPWGRFLNRYDIGPYTIFEFIPWKLQDHTILADQLDTTKRKYHGFVNGEDLDKDWDSLDEALVSCIAYLHDGPNSQAAHYFLRMICYQ